MTGGVWVFQEWQWLSRSTAFKGLSCRSYCSHQIHSHNSFTRGIRCSSPGRHWKSSLEIVMVLWVFHLWNQAWESISTWWIQPKRVGRLPDLMWKQDYWFLWEWIILFTWGPLNNFADIDRRNRLWISCSSISLYLPREAMVSRSRQDDSL